MTGYLPPPASGICCWIEVLAKPTQGISELPLAGLRARELVSRGGWGSELQVSALVSTPLGDAALARVSRPAYQLAASRIERCSSPAAAWWRGCAGSMRGRLRVSAEEPGVC